MEKRRIGTNEGNPKQSAYKKKKSRHEVEEESRQCLQIEKKVGTNEKKKASSTYNRKNSRHARRKTEARCLQEKTPNRENYII